MSKEKVISREYKIMLKKELFTGDERQLLKATSTFWYTFRQAINKIVIDVNGDLEKIAGERIIKFYDTDKHLLYRNYYILRDRYNTDTNERELTFKFRHPDRYISQCCDIRTSVSDKEKTKFEEDIKPPFLGLYSFSNTQIISPTENLRKLQDVARLYPNLPDKLTFYAEEEMKIVGVTVRELLFVGAKFQIRKTPKIDSECALIVWYNNNSDEGKPVAVEFSFRYKDENEDYTRNMALRAYDAFQALQEKLTFWVDPESKTKTAYIYS